MYYEISPGENLTGAVKRIQEDMSKHQYAFADIVFNGIPIQFEYNSISSDVVKIYGLERELNMWRNR